MLKGLHLGCCTPKLGGPSEVNPFLGLKDGAVLIKRMAFAVGFS